MTPKLLIISGLPAAGKTVLGKKIAQELSLPFISKDEMKEVLFDVLGYSDRDWSTQLSEGCFRLLDYLIVNSLASGNGIAIETNFQAKYDAERIIGYVSQYNAQAAELIFELTASVRLDRFRKRYESGERHCGHSDIVTPETEAAFLKNEYTPLLTNEQIVRVNTDDFNAIDIQKIASRIQEVLIRVSAGN